MRRAGRTRQSVTVMMLVIRPHAQSARRSAQMRFICNKTKGLALHQCTPMSPMLGGKANGTATNDTAICVFVRRVGSDRARCGGLGWIRALSALLPLEIYERRLSGTQCATTSGHRAARTSPATSVTVAVPSNVATAPARANIAADRPAARPRRESRWHRAAGCRHRRRGRAPSASAASRRAAAR